MKNERTPDYDGFGDGRGPDDLDGVDYQNMTDKKDTRAKKQYEGPKVTEGVKEGEDPELEDATAEFLKKAEAELAKTAMSSMNPDSENENDKESIDNANDDDEEDVV